MKIIKKAFLIIVILCSFTLSACNKDTSSSFSDNKNSTLAISGENTNGSKEPQPSESDNSLEEESDEMVTVSMIVGGKEFLAKFYNNESAKAITEQMPFSLSMSDFSGQEKVAPLSFDLPMAGNQTPSEIHSGEIYLWSGNQMVIFYTSFSSNAYSYVPIGYIEDVEGLTEALGNSAIEITFNYN